MTCKQSREASADEDECWLIVDAEPGATLDIGFNVELDEEAMRAAALDGPVEHLMTGRKVAPVRLSDKTGRFYETTKCAVQHKPVDCCRRRLEKTALGEVISKSP